MDVRPTIRSGPATDWVATVYRHPQQQAPLPAHGAAPAGVELQQQRAIGAGLSVRTERYNPTEYKARTPFPTCIISYRTASDGGKGDQHMWAIANYLEEHGITCYCALMVHTDNWQEEWFGKMMQTKLAIIMPSTAYWDRTSPCTEEVKAILNQGIPIFNLQVDDSCHSCMGGNFLGGSVEQITAAGFLKAKLGTLNCFPPPQKPLFQAEFDSNAAELVVMIKEKFPDLELAQLTAVETGHGGAPVNDDDEGLEQEQPPPPYQKQPPQQLATVTVPPGIQAGEQFHVNTPGGSTQVTCPPDVSGGSLTRIPIQSSDPRSRFRQVLLPANSSTSRFKRRKKRGGGRRRSTNLVNRVKSKLYSCSKPLGPAAELERAANSTDINTYSCTTVFCCTPVATIDGTLAGILSLTLTDSDQAVYSHFPQQMNGTLFEQSSARSVLNTGANKHRAAALYM
eukprot:SAG22_NODE_409_length_10939_cov_1.956638_5_plen_453_part_00